MLGPVECVIDRVVSDLFLLTVFDAVLVCVSLFRLVSVAGDRVLSVQGFNFSAVSVLLFVTIEDFVMGLVGDACNISELGHFISADLRARLKAMSVIVVGPVLDFILECVALFSLVPIASLTYLVRVDQWNLS